jgi:cbb3-type cytochrome oxidase cytochrome c subunit
MSGPLPVLTGDRERMAGLVWGIVALLFLSVLPGFLLPAVAGPGDVVRTSLHPFSEQALSGRAIYLEEGCGSCHTQMVRPIVADAHLGPVTVADTNQVIGYRRVGPDLAAIGGRVEDASALTSVLLGSTGNHPVFSHLSATELDYLVAYLMESKGE